MVAPPFAEGALHVSPTWPLPLVATSVDGAVGAAATKSDVGYCVKVLVPAGFLAAIRK